VRQILFVDDEPLVLDALEGLLRNRRRDWKMTFAVGGEAGLAALAERDYDVLVTDMRMPVVDGAALLRHARDHHPDVIRFALSGHTEFEVMLRTVAVAHQFLTKPCDPDVLRSTIERACELRDLLRDPVLRAVVGRIDALPSPPRLYAQLLVALENPQTTNGHIAAIVEQDIGLCARLLRVVNSAFFGPAQNIGRVGDAVRFLGASMVKWLVLSTEAYAGLGGSPDAEALIDCTTRHSLLAARIARELSGGRVNAEDALVACMLHDIGKCILATHYADAYGKITDAALSSARPVHEVELEQLGVTHAEVGAYLIGVWGLPYRITEAVAFHHAPGKAGRTSFDLVGVVHAADALADEAVCCDRAAEELDLEYLERVGVIGHVAGWRLLAQRIAERTSSNDVAV
jgi:putative nucleotidyltransferase with HDIG domain